MFVQVLCVDWLDREICHRAELRDACIGAVVGALRPLLPSGLPGAADS
ncbi:hypothetical protein [Streptomyces globosus]|nr:hypothetical protein [Streptomyces globosus]